jgi:hypothetical protein
MKWTKPKTWWASLLWVAVTYVLAADVLPNLLLLVVNSSGYLPYSDRPGPGWQKPHLPSKEEIQFFFGFAVLLLRGTALYGVLFSLVTGLLGFCRVPGWGLGLIGTPLAFVSSGIMMSAAGWMIAISSMGVYTAAICGGLWGFFIFPSLVPKTSYNLPLTIRIVAPLAVFAIGGYWLIRPLLPNRALTNAKVEVIRRKVPPGAPLSLDYLGPGFAGNVKEADTYSSVSRLEFTTDGKNQARALLIVDDPQPVDHTFVLPRTGRAVYRQSHGVWTTEQLDGKPSDISVTLTAVNSTLQTQGPCCSFMAASVAPYR